MQSAVESAREKTKVYARSIWSLIKRHSAFDLLMPKSREQEQISEPLSMVYRRLLYLLFAVPYILVVLFVLSFFWDFEGIQFMLFGFSFNLEGLIRILSVSGLIGFLTNWLAITMLFRPAQKRPLLGHGLIPAQKDKIAYQLAKTISKDLINPDIIKRKISESGVVGIYRRKATLFLKGIIDAPEFRQELKKILVEYMDEIMGDPAIRTALAENILDQLDDALKSKTFERVALKAYTFIRGDEAQMIIEETLAQLPETVESGLDQLDIMLDQLPEKIDEHSEQIENAITVILHRLINQLDVHRLVEDNIREFEEERLETMFRGATNEQLQYIQYLGAVLGTIGGFLIWEPLLSLVVLMVLVGSIVGLDYMLLKFKKYGIL